MLQVGDPFPDFSLQDQDGQTHTLAGLRGTRFVVYFYPKDDTPGCTTESCEFRDLASSFSGSPVFGVSPDGVKSHKKFADKFSLPFTLLADTDRSLCEACGVWVEKSMYGKKYMGVARTTFVVGPDGTVTHVWEKVKPEGHAAQVAAALGS
ncbi:MAG: thioredoxin-dependent thiol peroxidase [Fimbriimonadaceae bacterium]|nr:thioredoxin-dependent thiol peroxidase [Fimbriimonadaceae bacterium]